ncbi:MAG: PadR family transcriptional regulator [Vicinamibacterales bacterium]
MTPRPDRPADPRRHLPLKPVDLELLLSLADGDLHGYGLVQAIAARTDGLVVLDPGNLYRVIKRLLADGLVDEAGQREAPDAAGERRRYYRITPLGGRVLAAELDRLRRLVGAPATRAVSRRWTS